MKPRPEKNRTFLIAGRRWRWRYKRMRDKFGLCDYAERTVTIDATRSTAGLVRLDAEIHEALHALQAFAAEEHTAETATTLAQILWEIGYRLTDPSTGLAREGE